MDTRALPPTVEGILEQCPRFRILLVGKSGVGKSSLINHAFNVDMAIVAHQEHGICDINTEIISPQNSRFVLHDSQGFEPGEIENLKKVKSFIQSRGKGVALKDRVHAVWLCIQVPFAGGRVFETGDEEFLKFATKLEVPIVVVFTKFDLLVSRMEEYLTDEESDMPEEDIKRLCSQKAGEEFGELCEVPLQKIDHMLPYEKISVESLEYQSNIKRLIDLTQRRVEEYVEGDVWIVSAMAQRASAQAKVNASIKVGMKQYWQGLASSANFSGYTLEQCLNTIHGDIASCWNFNDPDNILNGDGFRQKIKTLAQLVTPETSELPAWFDSLNGIQSFIGVGSAVASAAAPAIAAIGLSAMFIKWITRVYQKSPEVLRCLMGYIVDLTLVMDQLFFNTLYEKPRSVRLTVDQVNGALEDYKSAAGKVHQNIREYVKEATLVKILRSINAEEKVIDLIEQHRLK